MRLLIAILIFVFTTTQLLAQVRIVSLLPNPAGEDALGEYIEVRNTGCENIDIGGYTLTDAGGKQYLIPSPQVIPSHENSRLYYADTKISLNNDGDTIILRDTTGNQVDMIEYSGTQKDDVVISVSVSDETCTSPQNTSSGTTDTASGSGTGSGIDTSSGTTVSDTGSLSPGSPSGSGSESATGAIDTSSGSLGSGATSTGSGMINDNVSSGSLATNSGGSLSGTPSESGSSLSGGVLSPTSSGGSLFPDIFPTLQSPSNATLSGTVFDCGNNDPCRINVTFEPIFTGSWLQRNYTCEILTETGILTTCNPNTLYFSTGGSWSFRLTDKSHTGSFQLVIYSVVFSDHAEQGSSISTSISSSSSGATGSSLSGVAFPEIIPTFQNYTNTIYSGDTLTCIMSPCRINVTFEPIFTGAFLEKDYTCVIHFGGETYNSCNPPQLYPIATGSLDITITHKLSSQTYQKIFPLSYIPPLTTGGGTSTSSIPPTVDIIRPVAVIDFDGKLKSYHESMSPTRMNCYTDTCAINLTAERSYDPGGGSLKYLWIYGPNDIKTTKDPGERKYGIGSHIIILRVIDAAGNYDEAHYEIFVSGTPEKPQNDDEKKKEKKPSKKEKPEESPKVLSGASDTGSYDPIPFHLDFFDPPEIILQNYKFVPTTDGYLCETDSKTCSLNLTLSGTQKGISYAWRYDDGTTIISKNPRSRSFAPGSAMIQLSASYGTGSVIWTRDIHITVISTRPPKKLKKPKVQKSASGEIETHDLSSPPDQPTPPPPSESSSPYVPLAVVGGSLGVIVSRRVVLMLMRV